MLLKDMKELTRRMDRATLEKALAECYKCVPKAKKEELDETLKRFSMGLTEPVKRPKQEEQPDMAQLTGQVEQFVEYARMDYYFMPNRVVSKSERGKWRFAVMRWVKALTAVREDSPDYDEANRLLIILYKILSYACHYQTFSTDDPFNSIGQPQYSYFDMLAKRVFVRPVSEEKLREMLSLAMDEDTDPHTLYTERYRSLCSAAQCQGQLNRLMELGMERFKQPAKKGQSTVQHRIAKQEAALFVLIAQLTDGQTDCRWYLEHVPQDP